MEAPGPGGKSAAMDRLFVTLAFSHMANAQAGKGGHLSQVLLGVVCPGRLV